jgi:hypothetical protein
MRRAISRPSILGPLLACGEAESKIRWEADSDNRLLDVPWSYVENESLILSCALHVEDHLKGDSGTSWFSSPSGEGSHPKHVPQPTFDVLVRVLLRDRLYCSHECSCCSHREAEPSFQGGRGKVDKDAISDGLRAGVTKDDSPKRLSDDRRFACRRAGAVKGEQSEAKRNK